jgi:hypothetical protein
VHVAHQERALREVRHQCLVTGAVESARGLAAEQALDDTRLVALGLQAADEPRARVAEALVVEVHRVLRGEYHAEPERARLLHQREHRQLGRWHGRRREEPEHFVHVEKRAQARRARLAAHPRDQLVRDQCHHEHALGVVQVRNRDDRDARPAFGGVEQALDVECFAVQPGLEPRRGEQAVDAQREIGAVFRGIEALEIEHADAVEGRLLDGLDDRGEVRALPLAPGRIEDRREQDVLAALDRVRLDAEQREQARHRGADAVLECRGVAQRLGARRGERAQHRQRTAGIRARRIDRDLRGGAQSRDALAVLAPLGEAVAPGLGRHRGELVRTLALARRLAFVHPRAEVLGAKVREREQQVADVALRVDRDRGHAVDRGLLEQRQAQARLAAAGHADADRVRGEVARVVEQVGAELLRTGIELATEVEGAEAFIGGEGHFRACRERFMGWRAAERIAEVGLGAASAPAGN